MTGVGGVISLASRHPDEVSGVLGSIIAEHGVPGISVAWGSADGVQSAVAGSINSRTGYPVQPETQFLVGSITKTFTAVAVMCLVERHLLDLDVPIRHYLPDLRFANPDTDAADVITLRLLLSHQAGVPSDNFEDFGRGDDCLARFTHDLRRHRLAHEPGAHFSYSNGGFSLIGRIIEAATGMVYDRAVRALVLTPLGLDEAGFLPEEVMHHSVALGHDLATTADGSTDATPRHWPALRAMAPEGLLVMSPRGLVRHGLAIADPATGVLTPDTVAEMLRVHVDVPVRVPGQPKGWSLGWSRDLRSQDAVAGHTGSIASSIAALSIDLDRRVAISVAVNAEGEGAGSALTAGLGAVAEALGVPSLVPRQPIATEPVELVDPERYTGTYEQLNSEYVVREVGGQLLLSASFGPCLVDDGAEPFADAPMMPVGQGRFQVMAPWGPETVLFHSGRQGDRPEALYTGASTGFRRAQTQSEEKLS